MPPLKITAVLDGGLAGDAPMLDAAIICVLSAHQGLRHSGSIPLEELDAVKIPIRRETIDGLPIPHCSSPIMNMPAADVHEHYHQAVGIDRVDMLRQKSRTVMRVGSGTNRSYRLPLRVRAVDRIVWFADGDRRGALKAVRHLTHLGKKTSYGYGRVVEWIIDRQDDDWSWFAPHPDGRVLMRPLPAGDYLPDDLIGYQPWFGGSCPPYWDRQHYREMVRPC